MSLPKIDVPVYTTELPSTGEVVKFRPFLVKEQKQLLIALGGDAEQQLVAVQDIVNVCTDGVVQAGKNPAYDIEYMFLQIRSRSVGEHIDLILTCGSCENKQETKLDITTVKVDYPETHSNDIEIGQGIVLKMRDPGILDLTELRDANSPDAIIRLIAKSIASIWQGNEVFDTKDYTELELFEFVENLSPQNLDSIEKFFQTLPALRHTIEFKCEKCGADNRAVLEGLQGFFV